LFPVFLSPPPNKSGNVTMSALTEATVIVEICIGRMNSDQG
jgi:hypothetical protein